MSWLTAAGDCGTFMGPGEGPHVGTLLVTKILRPQDWITHRLAEGPLTREEIRHAVLPNGRLVPALTERALNDAMTKLRTRGLVEKFHKPGIGWVYKLTGDSHDS